MSFLTELELLSAPAWVVLVVLVAVGTEAFGLPEALRLQAKDDSEHARGYVVGVRLGRFARILVCGILGTFLILGYSIAGYALGTILLYLSIAPARDFAAGFTHGVASESGSEPPSIVEAMVAAAYALATRGVTAMLCVAAA